MVGDAIRTAGEKLEGFSFNFHVLQRFVLCQWHTRVLPSSWCWYHSVFESDKQDYKRRTYCQLAASQRFCDSCLWFEDLLLQDWYTCEKVKCNCSMCVLHATIISILQPAMFVLSPRSSQSIHSVRSYEVYAYQCLFNVYKVKDVGKETACSFPCVWVCFKQFSLQQCVNPGFL